MLAPDAVLLGGGGGVVQAVVRPIVGAGKVARLLAVGMPRIAGQASAEPVQITGSTSCAILRSCRVSSGRPL